MGKGMGTMTGARESTGPRLSRAPVRHGVRGCGRLFWPALHGLVLVGIVAAILMLIGGV